MPCSWSFLRCPPENDFLRNHQTWEDSSKIGRLFLREEDEKAEKDLRRAAKTGRPSVNNNQLDELSKLPNGVLQRASLRKKRE